MNNLPKHYGVGPKRHEHPRGVERLHRVEFALYPQHETSCDSEIQTKEDFKSKFRKQLESLALMSLNSTDKEEALEYQC